MSVFIPLYHGVLKNEEFASDAFERIFQKHLPVEEFEWQIAWFCKNFTMLSIADYYQECISKTPDKNYAMVTFDDVYANFAVNALPVLEKYDCPATLFLCTGFAQRTRSSWTDEIERVVLNAQTDALTVGDQTFAAGDETSRIQAVLDIKTYVKTLSVERQMEAVNGLISEYDTGKPLSKAEMLSWEKALALKEHPLVTICHHSHSHNVLMNEMPEDLNADIERNIALWGKPEFFAYPYGIRDLHYNQSVVDLIRTKGFKAAFSVETHPDYENCNAFEVPRKEMHVGDHLEVAKRLEERYAES